jgi:hypothetical protein
MVVTMAMQRQAASRGIRTGKWAGLYGGLLGWFADQQATVMWVYTHCPVRSRALVLAIGSLCALAVIAGGLISLRVRQSLPANHTADTTLRTDRFIATLSVLMACLGLVAIVFGSAAGLVLRCER